MLFHYSLSQHTLQLTLHAIPTFSAWKTPTHLSRHSTSVTSHEVLFPALPFITSLCPVIISTKVLISLNGNHLFLSLSSLLASELKSIVCGLVIVCFQNFKYSINIYGTNKGKRKPSSYASVSLTEIRKDKETYLKEYLLW